MLDESQIRTLRGAEALLLDLDAGLHLDDRPADGARRLYDWFGDRLAVISNRSTSTRDRIAQRLHEHGLPLPPNRVETASDALIDVVAQRWPCARVLMLADRAVRDAARRRGLDLVEDDAEIVAVCRATRFTYGQLAAAVREVAQGAALIATNPEPSARGLDALPIPDAGSLVAAIRAAVPRAVPEFIGKPEPLLFRRACAAMACDPRKTVMVGTNPAIDGVGAARAGVAFVHIAEASGRRLPTLADVAAALERSVIAA